MNFKVGIGGALLAVALAGCHSEPAPTPTVASPTVTPKLAKLLTEDVKVGTGPTAAVGDVVVMEYKGTFVDGKLFDSNVPHDPKKPDTDPFTFQLAPDHANVIDGWNQGIVGMKVGGERKLSIPWALAYGEAGRDKIPPKTDLYFDVKLLGIVKAGHKGDYGFGVIKKGSGPTPQKNDWVTITYSAKLLNGKPVDDSTSLPHGTLQFQVGTGATGGKGTIQVKGILDAVKLMQAGGEYLLTLPPLLAANPLSRAGGLGQNIVRFDVKMLRILHTQGPPMDAPK